LLKKFNNEEQKKVYRHAGHSLRCLFFERRRLIDQHNRYIILYPIDEFTLVTDEAVSRSVETYVTLALRTA
jgi:hypothetical protein